MAIPHYPPIFFVGSKSASRVGRLPAMFVAATPFFLTRAEQIAALAARHRIPAIYTRREFAKPAAS
jgi:hypothetical protein